MAITPPERTSGAAGVNDPQSEHSDAAGKARRLHRQPDAWDRQHSHATTKHHHHRHRDPGKRDDSARTAAHIPPKKSGGHELPPYVPRRTPLYKTDAVGGKQEPGTSPVRQGRAEAPPATPPGGSGAGKAPNIDGEPRRSASPAGAPARSIPKPTTLNGGGAAAVQQGAASPSAAPPQPAAVSPLSAAPAGRVEATDLRAHFVRFELKMIAEAYNARPPGDKASFPGANSTLLARPEARLQMIDGLKRIHDALSGLTPSETEAVLDKLKPDELKYLALYDSRLQGYLRGEKALSEGVAGDFEWALNADEQTPAAARSAAPSVLEALTSKIRDPGGFAKLLTAWHEASQSSELSPALVRTRNVMWSFADRDQSIEPDSLIFPYVHFRFTSNDHDGMVNAGRLYIDSLKGQPDQLLKFTRAMASQVAAGVKYPMTAAKTRDGLPGDQPETHYGDARGVLVADAIAAIKRNSPEKLEAAFKLLPGKVLDNVAEAALQPVVGNYRPAIVEVLQAPANWNLQTGKFVREEIKRLGWHNFDAQRADIEPFLSLVDAAKDPSLIRREGSLEQQGDLRARMFETVKVLDRLRVTLASEERPINPLELAKDPKIKDAVDSLGGLLLVQTSATIAALRARDRIGDARWLSVWMALNFDQSALASLKPYNPNNPNLSARDQLALFKPGTPTHQLLQNLMLYDPREGPGDRRSTAWLQLGPEDQWANYWMNGLGAVRGDGIDWSRVRHPEDSLWLAVKGGYERSELGRGNMGYVMGKGYFGMAQYLATAVTDHIELERYEAERPLYSAGRAVGDLFSASKWMWRAGLAVIKGAGSAAVEVSTGWEILKREEILRNLEGQKQAIIDAVMPTEESLLRTSYARSAGIASINWQVFRDSKPYKEFMSYFPVPYGNTARTP